jgi:hypothetical protein
MTTGTLLVLILALTDQDNQVELPQQPLEGENHIKLGMVSCLGMYGMRYCTTTQLRTSKTHTSEIIFQTLIDSFSLPICLG